MPVTLYRCSTSSGVFEHDGRRVVAAGFQPFAVYEVAMASVAPHVERRPAPETVEEVLDRAPFALATDGYWSRWAVTRTGARARRSRPDRRCRRSA